MNHEFETVAWVDHKGRAVQIPVTVTYELDGYKPLGLWVYDEDGKDRTLDMTEAEYDLLYMKACDQVADNLACAIDVCYGERNGQDA